MSLAYFGIAWWSWWIALRDWTAIQISLLWLLCSFLIVSVWSVLGATILSPFMSSLFFPLPVHLKHPYILLLMGQPLYYVAVPQISTCGSVDIKSLDWAGWARNWQEKLQWYDQTSKCDHQMYIGNLNHFSWNGCLSKIITRDARVNSRLRLVLQLLG